MRILVTGDRSNAETGFAVYKKHLLRALSKEPNFEVAELGFAGHESMKPEFSWRFYPSSANRGEPDYDEYVKYPENRYGAWRWNSILLHFKPHIVISPIDPWQTNFQAHSPLRPYYHLCVAPPIDSGPISDKSLAILAKADSLVAYIDYGKYEMEKRGLGVAGVIPMGVSTDTFYEVPNRNSIKQKYGIPTDKKVFGFVARNQKRKRIPELMDAFRKYLNKYGDNAILYLHTTYPDLDYWDIPRYLIEYNLLDHVYFTYQCAKTKQCFARKFSDRFTYCSITGSITARMIDVNHDSPTAEQLNEVYNLFDVYIQAANCEGFGSPPVEAAATNARVILIDHTAMHDVGKLVNGILCSPKTLMEEKSVGTYRAVIDTDLLADKIHEAVKLGRATNGNELVKKSFDWKECCTDRWISYLKSLNLKDKWNDPKREFHFYNISPQMDFSDAVTNMSAPFNDFSYASLKEMEACYHGGSWDMREFTPMELNKIHPRYQQTLDYYSHIERIRCGELELEEQSWMR